MLLVSKQWQIIPLEKQKLVRSFLWAVVALIAMFVADYLTQFGLPEQLAFLAPFLPFIVNFLNKWAGEHKYMVKKQ